MVTAMASEPTTDLTDLRHAASHRPSLAAIWDILACVPDPEIPVVSVVDLGIVRAAAWNGDELVVTVTPTYSGCPATETIAADIECALIAAGVPNVRVVTQLSPAWTTDWMSLGTHKKLGDYGIAPPGARNVPTVSTFPLSGLQRHSRATRDAGTDVVRCPRCRSERTSEVSRHGSTPCKAQYRCADCLEPFDYFKPH
jgi:ring-1,2-phenylacetyl-CoA epoxidase subunit PaaD